MASAQPDRSIFSDPAESQSRLHDLGLSIPMLLDAVRAGTLAGFTCTQHDAPFFKGILVWDKVLAHLRRSLSTSGWHSNNLDNYATVLNDTLRVALAVAGADERTGLVGRAPSTRSDKGPRTISAIEDNNQLALFVMSGLTQPNTDRGWQTWVLLYYFDEDSQIVRSELSLPERMSPVRWNKHGRRLKARKDRGYIAQWRERILLPPFSVEPFLTAPLGDDDDQGDDTIDIPVTPKK